ncbi:hypothetical protein RF11_16186 [Thelohanellus kitauei]|uniref:Uncharacterized protein n=1 Tax=Thelohanellus kitauei TaxID=669202 RepID=A0A0C2N4J2_THEKT|nr:hypothetical protein RF11_16186 [Thelohanellus kitauei]
MERFSKWHQNKCVHKDSAHKARLVENIMKRSPFESSLSEVYLGINTDTSGVSLEKDSAIIACEVFEVATAKLIIFVSILRLITLSGFDACVWFEGGVVMMRNGGECLAGVSPALHQSACRRVPTLCAALSHMKNFAIAVDRKFLEGEFSQKSDYRQQIYAKHLDGYQEAIIPSYDSLQRTVQNIKRRQEINYQLPTRTDDLIIPEEFKVINNGFRFLLEDICENPGERINLLNR